LDTYNYITESFSFKLAYYIRQIFLIVFLSLFLFTPENSYSQFFNKEDSFIENSGDAAVIILPISAVATSARLKDKPGVWQFTKSFALNLAVTGAGKVLINKQRPLQGGDHAFPSGHTSVAFQSASYSRGGTALNIVYRPMCWPVLPHIADTMTPDMMDGISSPGP